MGKTNTYRNDPSDRMDIISEADENEGQTLEESMSESKSETSSDAGSSPASPGLRISSSETISCHSDSYGEVSENVNDLTHRELWRIIMQQVRVLRDLFENSAQVSLNGSSMDSPLSISCAWDSVVSLLEHLESHPTSKRVGTITSERLAHIVCNAVLRVRQDKEEKQRAKFSHQFGKKERSFSTPAAAGLLVTKDVEDQDEESSSSTAHSYQDSEGRHRKSIHESAPEFKHFASDQDLRELVKQRNEKALPRCFIHPSHPGRILWDLVSLIIVLADSVIMPFEMAYRANAPENAWFWIGTTFFTCDMGINFFTGFIAGPLEKDHGQLVTRKIRIAKHYLKSWFLIDFASTVPWSFLVKQIVGDSSESAGSARMAKIAKIAKLARFMRLARMLKLLKLQTIWENIESMIGSMIVVHILQLFKVLCLIAFMCHWNACIWWALGNPFSIFNDEEDVSAVGGTKMKELDQAGLLENRHWTTVVHRTETSTVEGNRWSLTYRWLDRSELETYVFCFYWTLGVMRTMPVEVFPVNEKERVYVLCFMFFAFSIFSICISKITQMFKKINSRRSEFDENMAALRSYLHEFGVNKDLRARIKSFLEFKFLKRRIFARETMLLNELSESLRAELEFAKIGPTLRSLWLFKGLQNRELTQIVLKSHQADAAPGDVLAQKGAVACQCWLLLSGGLTSSDPSVSGQRLSLLKEAFQHVDVDALFSVRPTVSEKSVWATDYCELIIIRKQEFLSLRQMHPALDAHVLRVVKEEKNIDLTDFSHRTKQELEEEDPFHVKENAADKRTTRMRRRDKDKGSRGDDDSAVAGAVVSAVG